MLGTGLRIGEALALTWDDANLENGTLRVNKTQVEFRDPDDPDAKTEIRYAAPKTRASNRTIPLLPEVARLLAALPAGSGLLFHRSGRGLLSGEIRRNLRTITKQMGVEGFTPHGLRHTFATRGFENGVELRVMQEILGHANINVTARIYTHVRDERKRDEIMKMRGML